MRRNVSVPFILLPAAVTSIWIAGCATIAGPRDVTIPIERLQESLAKKFPLNQRYLELFSITVSNPRLQLQSGSNRVMATVDAAVAPMFMPRRMTGSFTLSGLLAIDATRNAVVLREPRMEKLTLDGVDDVVTTRLAKISDLLAQKILSDVPVYNFDPEQFRYAGVQFFPTRINTTREALVVTFEPAK